MDEKKIDFIKGELGMYLKTKNQVLSLVETFLESTRYIKSHPETAGEHLQVCCQGCAVLEKFLMRDEESQPQLFFHIQEWFDTLLHQEQTVEEWDRITDSLLRELPALYSQIKLIPARLKVFFLPYKAEMWTALESIWRAFSQYPRCDTYVIPIPYHTLAFTENEEIVPDRFCYEGDKYPTDVPIVNYLQVDLEAEQPDVIFIHNPYDDFNNLTRVPEEYFSRNLRKVTDMLVYSPYCIISAYDPNTTPGVILTPASQHVHRIIVQSEKAAKIYTSLGIDRKKLLVCGSPKIDAIVNGTKETECVPKEWQEKLRGKTVFLMNTHIGFFLVVHSQYRIEDVKYVLKFMKEHPDYALIWRPHPLLFDMLRSRGQVKMFAEVMRLIMEAEQMENVIVDRLSSYMPAFTASHAMLSSYSSLVPEYMTTGKPTMFLDIRYVTWGPHSNKDICMKGPVPIHHNYFPADFPASFPPYDESMQDGTEIYFKAVQNSYGDFMEMVHNGIDLKGDDRMKDVAQAFTHIDGTSGEKVCNAIKKVLD